MRISVQLKFPLILAVSLCLITIVLSPEVSCHRLTGGPNFRDREFERVLKSNWSCSQLLSGKLCEIKIAVADDGKIYDPEILHSSSNDQFDAECLEAICSVAPLEEEWQHGFLDGYVVKFLPEKTAKQLPVKYLEIGPKYQGIDVIEYSKQTPQSLNPHEKTVFVHKIPLSVLVRYPGLFKESELLCKNNLIAVYCGQSVFDEKENTVSPPPNYLFKVANLYFQWARFFLDHKPRPSREQIEEFAKSAEVSVR
jgi:hypothetical protein